MLLNTSIGWVEGIIHHLKKTLRADIQRPYHMMQATHQQ